MIGNNGCGKTTLLQLLLGKIKPVAGTVELGTNLEVAYFDQLRDQLDEDKNIIDNIAQGSEFVEINQTKIHIMSYLKKFLFDSARARTPLSALSGGEKNRVLMAKILALPSNILVLDEPTNDLDIETLEVLEDMLIEYPGAVILISHDRNFINNIATSSLVFENGEINEYIGGYDDWIRQSNNPVKSESSKIIKQDNTAKQTIESKSKLSTETKKNKLSYKDKKKLDALPKEIEALEKELAQIETLMADNQFYQQDQVRIQNIQEQYNNLQAMIKDAYNQWENLALLSE